MTKVRKVQGFTWTVADTNLITGSEVFGDVLVELGAADPRIVALTADLGSTTKIGRFQQAFPRRFFNVGVAEQNLIAVASGLAAVGLTPVVSTYAVFASMRAAEFLRTDLCYNRRNVKVIATLSGVSFGQGGPTHHSLEDIALLRAMPGMVVLAPCDGYQAGAALRAALAHDGPVYLRLGRGMDPPVYPPDAPFTIGRAHPLRQGPADRVTVLACGTTVHHAVAAADRAAALGVPTRVLDMASLKPLDDGAVLAALADTGRLVTVEDHSVLGGLGSAVADVIAASGQGCRLRKLGHQDTFAPQGIPEDLMHLCGIDEDAILDAICDLADAPRPASTWGAP